jgi:hypothetical protein
MNVEHGLLLRAFEVRFGWSCRDELAVSISRPQYLSNRN